MDFGSAGGINSAAALASNGWSTNAGNFNNGNYYTSTDVLQWWLGDLDGYIKQTLPSGYNYAVVSYGASQSASYSELFIGGVSKGTVQHPGVKTDANFAVWGGYYNQSDEIEIIEYGIAPSKVKVIGMPIQPCFQPVSDDEQQALRQQMGLDPEKFTVFFNAGWAGGGNIPKIFKRMSTYIA